MTEIMIALLRGINVGRAKRVRMAELRDLVAELGCRDVRTVLNSGNVVFSAPGADPQAIAAAIEASLAARTGISARVTVLRATELAALAAENPLVEPARDPSRLLVAVFGARANRSMLEPLLRQDWSPEGFAVGARAAYLWCPDGVLASRVAAAVERALGDAVTSRNWTTVGRIVAIAAGGDR